MKRPLFRFDRLLLAALAIIAAPQAQAQTTYTWTNTGSSTTWLQTAPWQTNGVTSTTAPSNNSTAVARFTNNTNYATIGINLNASALTNTVTIGTLLKEGSGNSSFNNSSTTVSGQLRVAGTGAETNLIVSLGTGTLTLTNGTSQAMDLQLGTSGTINVSNSIGNVTIFSLIKQDSGKTNGFNKTGDGTLTIGGTNSNTYSGLTTLSAGTLRFNKTAGQNVSAGDILINGGNLVLQNSNQMSDTIALTNSGGTNDFGGFTDTVGSYVQTSGLFTNGTLTAATYGLSGGTVAGNLGAGTINVTGNTALNGTAGAGTLNIISGMLTLGSGSRLTGTTPVVTISNGATLTLGGAETLGSIAGSGTIALGSNSLTAGSANSSTTFGGVISGTGVLTKNGTGTLTLAGTNTYSGGTLVSAGTLVGDTKSLQGTITNNATVTFSQTNDGPYTNVMSG